jgi:hypothetical protein
MPDLNRLLLALALSLGLYLAVFTVVHRPLTIGEIPRLLHTKLDYAASLPGPRLVVFAGSNGRYSHRCAVLEPAVGRGCVNMSIAVDVGLDFLLDQLLRMLRPGDLLYLPLEYSQYAVTHEQMDAGAQNAVLVQELRGELWRLDAARIVRAYGAFDLSYLVQGVLEMALSGTGFQRRTGLATLTPQGDERGHTASAGLAYRDFLRTARFGELTVPASSHAITVLTRFLAQARQRGVHVVGGLPTIPDSVPLPPATVDALRALYRQQGQGFLVLPNRSQYPLSCFFDTLNHLNEECQLEHSRALGLALAAALTGRP